MPHLEITKDAEGHTVITPVLDDADREAIEKARAEASKALTDAATIKSAPRPTQKKLP